MESIITITLWLVFSFLIGSLGSKRKIGFGWAFFISILLSPVIGLIITLLSDRKEDYSDNSLIASDNYVSKGVNSKSREKNEGQILDELTKLKSLFDSGTLSQEEFDSLKSRILEKGTSSNQKNITSEKKDKQCPHCKKIFEKTELKICPSCGFYLKDVS